MNTFFNLKLSSFLNYFSSGVGELRTTRFIIISNLVYRTVSIHTFSVQIKFYAIHTYFLPAVLNSTSVRLRYSN